MNLVSKTIAVLTLVVAGCYSSYAQPVIPKDFVREKPPKSSTDKWFALNHSHNEFGVANENGLLVVRKVKEVNKGELALSNGKLVGTDNGEFPGSRLVFIPADTSQQEQLITGGNIKHIFRLKGDVYFIDALAHGGSSRGTLYLLDTTATPFGYTKVLEFEDAPEAYTVYKDKILIASYEGFFVVRDGKKEQIASETFWGGLYPTSVAVFDDEHVFIGMRGGIVKMNLLTKQFTFYKYIGG